MERNIDDHEVGGREVGSPSKRRNKMQKPSPSSSLQPTITDAKNDFSTTGAGVKSFRNALKTKLHHSVCFPFVQYFMIGP